ncbi:MAG: trigger factor family protein, partial [Elusimicrobiales bacterium]|nr:trigger factor family protein [Elusimicrobiales bacterium]
MNYKKEKNEGCIRIYDISFDLNDYVKIEDDALKAVQSVVTYPGFRKGKVPFEIIKEHFFQALSDEIRERAVHKSIDTIMENEKIIPVVSPSVYDIKHDSENRKISFKLYFEIAPEFEPKGYTDFEIVKKIKKITDKDIDNYIEQIRQYNSYLQPVDEPVSNDKY